MFAAAGIYEIHNEIHEIHYMMTGTGTGTGRGNPPPGPLHDILEDLKATGRGGPGPRPLHPARLFSIYGQCNATVTSIRPPAMDSGCAPAH